MDSAQMGKTFIALPQGRQGGVVVALSAFSAFELCQDPKCNERRFQSWNSTRDLRPQPNSTGSSECEKKEGSHSPGRKPGGAAHRCASPARTNARPASLRDWVANE